jgi:hypothetical protein
MAEIIVSDEMERRRQWAELRREFWENRRNPAEMARIARKRRQIHLKQQGLRPQSRDYVVYRPQGDDLPPLVWQNVLDDMIAAKDSEGIGPKYHKLVFAFVIADTRDDETNGELMNLFEEGWITDLHIFIIAGMMAGAGDPRASWCAGYVLCRIGDEARRARKGITLEQELIETAPAARAAYAAIARKKFVVVADPQDEG